MSLDEPPQRRLSVAERAAAMNRRASGEGAAIGGLEDGKITRTAGAAERRLSAGGEGNSVVAEKRISMEPSSSQAAATRAAPDKRPSITINGTTSTSEGAPGTLAAVSVSVPLPVSNSNKGTLERRPSSSSAAEPPSNGVHRPSTVAAPAESSVGQRRSSVQVVHTSISASEPPAAQAPERRPSAATRPPVSPRGEDTTAIPSSPPRASSIGRLSFSRRSSNASEAGMHGTGAEEASRRPSVSPSLATPSAPSSASSSAASLTSLTSSERRPSITTTQSSETIAVFQLPERLTSDGLSPAAPVPPQPRLSVDSPPSRRRSSAASVPNAAGAVVSAAGDATQPRAPMGSPPPASAEALGAPSTSAHSRAPSGMSRQSSLTLEAEDEFEPVPTPIAKMSNANLPPLPPRRQQQPPPPPQQQQQQLQQEPSHQQQQQPPALVEPTLRRRSSRLDFLAEAAGKAQNQIYGQLRNIVRARVDTIDGGSGDFRAMLERPTLESPQGSFRLRGDSTIRPRSTRLSNADVDFMLSRVSKISGESLRKAAIENNAALTEALIRGSVFVDDVDARGRTALMWAAREGSMDAAIHLVELDASLELKDEGGMTAIAHAVENGRWATFRALAECGADLTVVDGEGRTLLTRALAKLDRLSEPQPGVDGRKAFAQTAEICKALVASTTGSVHTRENLKPATNYLLDEWTRAKAAAEPLVVPAYSDMLGGEPALAAFFKTHRWRVNRLAAAKIFIVLGFVLFDLVMREMEFTPLRVLVYVGLYVGAYYA